MSMEVEGTTACWCRQCTPTPEAVSLNEAIDASSLFHGWRCPGCGVPRVYVFGKRPWLIACWTCWQAVGGDMRQRYEDMYMAWLAGGDGPDVPATEKTSVGQERAGAPMYDGDGLSDDALALDPLLRSNRPGPSVLPPGWRCPGCGVPRGLDLRVPWLVACWPCWRDARLGLVQEWEDGYECWLNRKGTAVDTPEADHVAGGGCGCGFPVPCMACSVDVEP